MQLILEQVRAIDTVLKRANLADLPALADAHGRFETIVKRAAELGSMTADSVAALAAHGESARRILESLILHDAADPHAALKAASKTLADMTRLISNAALHPVHATPPADGAHVFAPEDLALASDFVVEAAGHLETAEQSLLRLEEDPDDADAVAGLFRAFHTLKGVAGFLNLQQMQTLAHAAENFLDGVRDGRLRVAAAAADRLLAAIDLARKMVNAIDVAAKAAAPLMPLPGVDVLAAELNALAAATAPPKPELDAFLLTDPPAIEPPAAAAETSVILQTEAAEPPVRPAADQSVKVATERLDALIDMVGELVIASSMVSRDVADQAGADRAVNRAPADPKLAAHVGQLTKIVRDLQGLAMSMRMVPVGTVLRKMNRLVRDVSRKTGKPVELAINGGDIELDRHIVDALADPLVHMLRNSIDHGIESPDQRERAGKPRTGKLSVTASHQRGGVHIELTDDGRGLDRPRILAKAVQSGLMAAGDQPTEAQIDELIFAPGLSTAEKVTEFSGRGVGMDVVRRNIEGLRGRVDIATSPGHGSRFTIRLPLTMSVIDGLVVRVGPETYVVPVVGVDRSLRPAAGSVSSVHGRGEVVVENGACLPLVRLHTLFDVPPRATEPHAAMVVIVHDAGRRAGLMVDELIGQEQVVIKPLGHGLGRVRGISGGAVLGDGRVALILDVPGVMSMAA